MRGAYPMPEYQAVPIASWLSLGDVVVDEAAVLAAAWESRRVAEASGAVGGTRKPVPAAEGAVGERASAVQVGAVREFIETMRQALDKLEEAFEEGD